MSDLREQCRCGHARSSHAEGTCRTCECWRYEPAYPVLDEWPNGVRPVRDYRSGLTLVACSHADVKPADPFCSFCKGSTDTTAGYALPVQRLVVAPRELTLL